MADTFLEELKVEIESFRAEVRGREERRRERGLEGDTFAAPDLTRLDPTQIKELISQRYENARLLRRLEAAEHRIAELEGRNARP